MICAMPLKSKLMIRTTGERQLKLWACLCKAHMSDRDEQIAVTMRSSCCSSGECGKTR